MELNNFTKFKIDTGYLKKLAEKVLKGEPSFAKATEGKGKKIDLSISLVSPEEIRKLNKKYRKTDKSTDVLSFTYQDSGEIVLCPRVIKENAKKYGENFKKELARVLVHGILHTLGYNHEKGAKEAEKMRKKEEYYIKLT